MKIFITFVFILNFFVGHSQDTIESKMEKNIEIILNKIKANSSSEEDKKELKQIAYQIQNTGQSIAETYKDNTRALKYIDKAILLFSILNESLNEANNRKFKGYLLATVGKFPEAKNEIKIALYLFALKKDEKGIAVSKFDLSRVYEYEHNLDSAIYYCDTSLIYWKSINERSRIFNNQNMFINLLTKSKQYERAKVIQKESNTLVDNKELYWQDIIDFYIVSIQLFKATGDKDFLTKYQKLLHEKTIEINKKGNFSNSYYNNL